MNPRKGRSTGWRRWTLRAFRKWLTAERRQILEGQPSWEHELYMAWCGGCEWKDNLGAPTF